MASVIWVGRVKAYLGCYGGRLPVPKTIVTFSLRLPVVASEAEPTIQLDELVKAWRATKGVVAVEIEWKSRRTAAPRRPSTAYADAKVEIESATHKGLQKLYGKLSGEANKEPGRLSSRSCNLIEMFGQAD